MPSEPRRPQPKTARRTGTHVDEAWTPGPPPEPSPEDAAAIREAVSRVSKLTEHPLSDWERSEDEQADVEEEGA